MERKYLTQALITESIIRLEDAARTEAEFKNVIKWWDELDKRIQDALDKKVLLVVDMAFDIGLARKGDHRQKNLFGGRNQYDEDYLSLIYGCICQMHNLTDDKDLSRLLEKATDKQKAIFYPRAILNCSPQKIAECHEMTDRNVRDIVDRMISNIRMGMYEALVKRKIEGIPLTLRQKQFIDTVKDVMETAKPKAKRGRPRKDKPKEDEKAGGE